MKASQIKSTLAPLQGQHRTDICKINGHFDFILYGNHYIGIPIKTIHSINEDACTVTIHFENGCLEIFKSCDNTHLTIFNP